MERDIFDRDNILAANLAEELSFDRAYIRLRRGNKFATRTWEEIPPRPGRMVAIDRDRAYQHLLAWLVRRFQLKQLYVQGEPVGKIPQVLTPIDSLENVGTL